MIPILILGSIISNTIAIGCILAFVGLGFYFYRNPPTLHVAARRAIPMSKRPITKVAHYEDAKRMAIEDFDGKVREDDVRGMIHFAVWLKMMHTYFEKIEIVNNVGASKLDKGFAHKSICENIIYRLWKGKAYIIVKVSIGGDYTDEFVEPKKFDIKFGSRQVKVQETKNKKTVTVTKYVIPVIHGFTMFAPVDNSAIVKEKTIKELAANSTLNYKPPKKYKDVPTLYRVQARAWGGLGYQPVECKFYQKYDDDIFPLNYPPMHVSASGEDFNNKDVRVVMALCQKAVELRLSILCIGGPGSGKSKFCQVLSARLAQDNTFRVYEMEPNTLKLVFNPEHSGIMSDIMSSQHKNVMFLDDMGGLLRVKNNKDAEQGALKSLLGGNLQETLNSSFVLTYDGKLSDLSAALTRHGRLSLVIFFGNLPREQAIKRKNHFKKHEATDDLIYDDNKLNMLLEKKTPLSSKDEVALSEWYSGIKDMKMHNLMTKGMKELIAEIEKSDEQILQEKNAAKIAKKSKKAEKNSKKKGNDGKQETKKNKLQFRRKKKSK